MFFFFFGGVEYPNSSYPGVRSLADVPGLRALADICAELDVNITAHGSFVRRFVNHLILDLPILDLFPLLPLICFIDLTHTGEVTKTQTVREHIFERIPY